MFTFIFSIDGGDIETGCVVVDGATKQISDKEATTILNATQVSKSMIKIMKLSYISLK